MHKIPEVIELPHKLSKWGFDYEDGETIKEFIRNPSGYLTVDCSRLKEFEKCGLDPIVEAAYKLQNSKKGYLELVNVDEDIYRQLMNIKIPKAPGKRLICLAEIYTNRTRKEIMHFAQYLIYHNKHHGVDVKTLVKTFIEAAKEYEALHGDYDYRPLGPEEPERTQKECGLIRCIRLIEENKQDPNKIDHLAYVYGQVAGINVFGNIDSKVHDTTYQRKDKTKPTNKSILKEGQRYQGVCKVWFWERGYGLITPDVGGTDIFVHASNIAKGAFLVEDWRYEFTVRIDKSKKKWQAVDVTETDS